MIRFSSLAASFLLEENPLLPQAKQRGDLDTWIGHLQPLGILAFVLTPMSWSQSSFRDLISRMKVTERL